MFLLTGVLFRNPMIPAAVVFVWENLNPFLPSLLKKFSIIFYLKSLCPVGEIPADGPLAFLATMTEPTPAWLAIPGLLIVSGPGAGLRRRQIPQAGSQLQRLTVN